MGCFLKWKDPYRPEFLPKCRHKILGFDEFHSYWMQYEANDRKDYNFSLSARRFRKQSRTLTIEKKNIKYSNKTTLILYSFSSGEFLVVFEIEWQYKIWKFL